MSSTRAMTSGDSSDWIPLTRAAALAGVTAYTLKTAVIGGLIRARVLPGFPTLYSRSDTMKFVESRA
jgi:hypothetical protein